MGLVFKDRLSYDSVLRLLCASEVIWFILHVISFTKFREPNSRQLATTDLSVVIYVISKGGEVLWILSLCLNAVATAIWVCKQTSRKI